MLRLAHPRPPFHTPPPLTHRKAAPAAPRPPAAPLRLESRPAPFGPARPRARPCPGRGPAGEYPSDAAIASALEALGELLGGLKRDSEYDPTNAYVARRPAPAPARGAVPPGAGRHKGL